MPSDNDRDLDQQLRAFGATLADRTGEPIAPAVEPSVATSVAPAPLTPVAPAAAGASRRRWVLVGAAACVVALVAGLVVVARGGGGEVLPVGQGDSDGLGPLGSLGGVGMVVEGTVVEHRGSRATLSAFGGVDYEGRSENADEWTTPNGFPVIVLDDTEVVRAIGGSDAADALAADAEAQVAAGTAIEVLAPVGVFEIGERYQLWLQPYTDFGFMTYLAFADDGRPVEGLGAPGLDEAIAALTEHTGESVLDSLAALAREMNVRGSGGEQGPLMDFVFGPVQPESSGPGDTTTADAEASVQPLTEPFHVPIDALLLSSEGYVLEQQSVGGVRDVSPPACLQSQEAAALAGGYVVTERWVPVDSEDPWVLLQYARFPDAPSATSAMAPLALLPDCRAELGADSVEAAIDLGASSDGVIVSSARVGDQWSFSAVDGTGRVVLARVVGAQVGEPVSALAAATAVQLAFGRPWLLVTSVPAREATAEEIASLGGDDRGLVCDSNGAGAAGWERSGDLGDGEPRGRQAVDAFRDALADLAQDAQRDGGRVLPTEGWTELVTGDGDSSFVLEVDGVRQAVISVAGDPALGVWRHNSADVCQSLFLPEGYVLPTTLPVVTTAPPPAQPPDTTAPLDGTIPGQLSPTVEAFLPGEPAPSIAPDDQVLVLMVSNQSFEDDAVSLWMGIDGIQLTADRYEVRDQHTVTTYLVRGFPPGRYELTVETDTGVAHTATVTVNDGAPRWAYVTYWYYPDDGEGRYVNVFESDEPIAID